METFSPCIAFGVVRCLLELPRNTFERVWAHGRVTLHGALPASRWLIRIYCSVQVLPIEWEAAMVCRWATACSTSQVFDWVHLYWTKITLALRIGMSSCDAGPWNFLTGKGIGLIGGDHFESDGEKPYGNWFDDEHFHFLFFPLFTRFFCSNAVGRHFRLIQFICIT